MRFWKEESERKIKQIKKVKCVSKAYLWRRNLKGRIYTLKQRQFSFFKIRFKEKRITRLHLKQFSANDTAFWRLHSELLWPWKILKNCWSGRSRQFASIKKDNDAWRKKTNPYPQRWMIHQSTWNNVQAGEKLVVGDCDWLERMCGQLFTTTQTAAPKCKSWIAKCIWCWTNTNEKDQIARCDVMDPHRGN